jgi:hypothetical protein
MRLSWGANGLTDVRHSRDRRTVDKDFDDLASIQIAFGFIGIQVVETQRIEMREEHPMYDRASTGQDVRVAGAGFTAFEPDKSRRGARELLAGQSFDALWVHQGAIYKEMNRLLAWHTLSSSAVRGYGACWGRGVRLHYPISAIISSVF